MRSRAGWRLHAQIAQHLNGGHQRDFAQLPEDDVPGARQFGKLDPRGNDAKARIVIRERLQERLHAGVLDAARLRGRLRPAMRRILQRLQPVEDQERALRLYEMRQIHALLIRVARRLFSTPAEVRERGFEEIVSAGLPVLVRALAVEAPGEDGARAVPAGRFQRLHKVIDECGLSAPPVASKAKMRVWPSSDALSSSAISAVAAV